MSSGKTGRPKDTGRSKTQTTVTNKGNYLKKDIVLPLCRRCSRMKRTLIHTYTNTSLTEVLVAEWNAVISGDYPARVNTHVEHHSYPIQTDRIETMQWKNHLIAIRTTVGTVYVCIIVTLMHYTCALGVVLMEGRRNMETIILWMSLQLSWMILVVVIVMVMTKAFFLNSRRCDTQLPQLPQQQMLVECLLCIGIPLGKV